MTAAVVLAALRLPLVEGWVLQPWGRMLAGAAAGLLHGVGVDVAVTGDTLGRAGHSLSVSAECSGLELLALYTGLTLLYPVSWRWRIAGVVAGGFLLQAANLGRILGLFLLSDPMFFHAFHIFLWPAVLVVFTCVLWAAWATLASGRRRGEAGAAMTFRLPWTRMLIFCGCVGGLMIVRALVLNAPATHAFAHAVAGGSAGLLTLVGIPTVAVEELVRAGTTALLVGAGCAASPTLVIALAAIVVVPLERRPRVIAFVLLLPLFYAANVLRVAAVVAALVHWPGVWRWLEDYFLLTSLITGLVVCLAHWHARALPDVQKAWFWCRVASAVMASVLGTVFGGRLYWDAIMMTAAYVAAEATSSPGLLLVHNPEGILLALPVLQNLLFLVFALGWRWRWQRMAVGMVTLYVSQVACVVVVWLLSEAFAVQTHHFLLRGWIILLPCILLWLGLQADRRRVAAL